VKAFPALTEAQLAALEGDHLGEDSYDHVFREDVDVVRPDGSTLFKLRRGRLPHEHTAAAWTELRQTDRYFPGRDNRSAASGDPHAYRPLKDGTLSRTHTGHRKPRSGVVGYYDRVPRFPFCRLTRFNRDYPLAWQKLLPWLLGIDDVFRAEEPERYAAQRAYAQRCHPDFIIGGTAFSTLTVNRNWQTAVHRDAGDYPRGFGVMTVFRAGAYEGCFTVWPRYRVAADLRTGDVILADVHEWHGNSPLRGLVGRFERLAVILYLRTNMIHCRGAAEELERAKRRRPGEPLNGGA